MQSANTFRLTVRQGPIQNQKFDLNQPAMTIGRGTHNDIVIDSPGVSETHARVTRTADGYNIQDMKSETGTFINSDRITTSQPLTHGDVIGLGETVTVLYQATYQPQTAPQPVGSPQSGQQGTPQNFQPIINITNTSTSSASIGGVAGKENTTAFIIGFIAGIFGFLGVAHMINGKLGTGILYLLLGWFIWIPILVVITGVTGGLGVFCTFPLEIIVAYSTAKSGAKYT